jgi:hypothetical protein
MYTRKKNKQKTRSCVQLIFSCDCVTVDGVWIGSWIY